MFLLPHRVIFLIFLSDFAKSRHSLRYYGSGSIQIETIEKSISLAQTAPSACNRQPVHVFACTNTEKIEMIMSFHGGIKGFGRPRQSSPLPVLWDHIPLSMNEIRFMLIAAYFP